MSLTYEQFKKVLTDDGYECDLHYNHHQVAVIAQDLGSIMGGNTTVATVDKNNQGRFSMFDVDETPLSRNDWLAICSLCQLLAATPIEKRGKIKRWWQK